MKRNGTIIVPFFISNQGCPNLCVFCDQKRITGDSGGIPGEKEISAKVDEYAKYSGDRDIHLAFYGGSFTSLDVRLQEELLAAAAKLKKNGKISGVRISTRPDSINDVTVGLLSFYSVDLVELGVQSFSDRVLELSNRGLSSEDAFNAASTLSAKGISFGIQLMTGLPGDTPADSIESCRKALTLNPSVVRFYPTVVLKDTMLASMFLSGHYLPWSEEKTVSTLKNMLWQALKAHVRVARIGLQSSDGLNEMSVIAGFNHPAAGEVVYSALFFDLILDALGGRKCERLEIFASSSSISSAVGHKGVNKCRLKDITGASEISYFTDNSLKRTEIILQADSYRAESDILKVNYDY